MTAVVPLVPQKYKPLAKAALPHLLKGDAKGALKAAKPILKSQFKSLFLAPFLLKVAKMPILSFDCIIKNFIMPVADGDYRVSLLAIKNTDPAKQPEVCHSSTKCKPVKEIFDAAVATRIKQTLFYDFCNSTESKLDWSGPLRIVVARTKKSNEPKTSNHPLTRIKNPECAFMLTYDQHRCDLSMHSVTKNAAGKPGYRPCTQPWAWVLPRSSSSSQLISKNDSKNDKACKRWYTSTMALLNSIIEFLMESNNGKYRAPCTDAPAAPKRCK